MEVAASDVKKVINRVRFREQAIENDVRKFLEKTGWKYTCSNPASLWLFEKTLPDGRVALVDQSTALNMQASLSR